MGWEFNLGVMFLLFASSRRNPSDGKAAHCYQKEAHLGTHVAQLIFDQLKHKIKAETESCSAIAPLSTSWQLLQLW